MRPLARGNFGKVNLHFIVFITQFRASTNETRLLFLNFAPNTTIDGKELHVFLILPCTLWDGAIRFNPHHQGEIRVLTQGAEGQATWFQLYALASIHMHIGCKWLRYGAIVLCGPELIELCILGPMRTACFTFQTVVAALSVINQICYQHSFDDENNTNLITEQL